MLFELTLVHPSKDNTPIRWEHPNLSRDRVLNHNPESDQFYARHSAGSTGHQQRLDEHKDGIRRFLDQVNPLLLNPPTHTTNGKMAGRESTR